MSRTVDQLEPRNLWRYFARLSEIPRCSKHEGPVLAWLDDLAREKGVEIRSDGAGNRLMRLPATPGHENAPTVVMQGHVDMVCEKDPDVTHDFSRDPIRPIVDGDVVRAQGTTLGADNGIGVATALAFLDEKEAVHGPLELLFTVDEETGLTGARALAPEFFSGRILFNMDSEVLGRFTIGSAGGGDSILTLCAPRSPWPQGAAYKLEIGGLVGGHSGADIHRHRGNSLKILARLLAETESDLRLGPARGGTKRNAIAREAEAWIAVSRDAGPELEAHVRQQAKLIGSQYGRIEPDLGISLHPANGEAVGFAEPEESRHLIHLLDALPCGVIDMSLEFPGIVETSSSIGILEDLDDGYRVICSSRSASDEALAGILGGIGSLAHLAGAEIERSDAYPAWPPRLGTPLLKTVEAVYRRLFDADPTFELIHGGLECGLFLGAYPDLQIVSCGAKIDDAHSPRERVRIASVERLWRFARALLAELAGSSSP